MPVVHFPDAGGDTVTLQQYGDKGNLIPATFSEEVVENIPNVTLAEEDVLICSYPKTGTHWLWEITSMLRAGSTKVHNTEKIENMLEMLPQSALHQMPPGKILSTHVLFHQLPENVRNGRVKIVFIYRNPKDTAVSFYHFLRKVPIFEYGGQFNNFLTGLFFKGLVPYGDFFTYMKEWEKVLTSRFDIPIFALSYEELLAATFRKTKELAAFLGFSVDDNTIQEIVEECSFSKMSSRYESQEGKKLSASIVCRKGKVGDWKNWFTVAQSERMDQMISQEMKGSKFEFQFTL